MRGISSYQIAKNLGKSQSVVYKALCKYGLKTICRPGPSNTAKANVCKDCSALTSNIHFCSLRCQGHYRHIEQISLWKLDDKYALTANGTTKQWLKNYLRNKYKNSCSSCGWNTINVFTHRIPLEVDHIDGNWRNNKEDNLRLLCPNCHALTATYKGRNKGNGRPFVNRFATVP